METLIYSPLFGISISILAFSIGLGLGRKFKLAIFNPLLIAGLLVILLLEVFKIDLEAYSIGGSYISFFIGPATVALAVPLYKNFDLLRKKWPAVLIGIVSGVLAGMLTVIILGRAFGLDGELIRSLLPKSTTAAIGLGISEANGGIVELTAIFIVATGIFGNMIAERVFKLFKFEDSLAKGLALGTSCHVMGSAKAMELGEVEGAFASVGISLAGIITVFLSPLIISLLLN